MVRPGLCRWRLGNTRDDGLCHALIRAAWGGLAEGRLIRRWWRFGLCHGRFSVLIGGTLSQIRCPHPFRHAMLGPCRVVGAGCVGVASGALGLHPDQQRQGALGAPHHRVRAGVAPGGEGWGEVGVVGEGERGERMGVGGDILGGEGGFRDIGGAEAGNLGDGGLVTHIAGLGGVAGLGHGVAEGQEEVAVGGGRGVRRLDAGVEGLHDWNVS